jgi:integrase
MTSTTRSTHYQDGCIDRVSRKNGPDVWVFRWRETQLDTGKRKHKSKTIGTVIKYPTVASVKTVVENLRAEINAGQAIVRPMTIKEAWGHFQANELRDPDVARSASTIEQYLSDFKVHIIPRWGELDLTEVKAVDVEKWLRGLKLAPGTKSKLRNTLSSLFAHAIRHELYLKINPISAVRQGSKRIKIPDILSMEEVGSILKKLTSQVAYTAVMVAAVTGLRRSEIRGLKWSDIDFENLWISLRQGVVRGHVTGLKTEASKKGIPIPQDLADILTEWRRKSKYKDQDDWVFAGESNKGKTPLWLDIMMQNYIRPAVKAAKITKVVGWHTFRRSLASLLATKGEQIKVVQELLRHANSSTTQDLYQQADVGAKREAQSHTSELFLVKQAG